MLISQLLSRFVRVVEESKAHVKKEKMGGRCRDTMTLVPHLMQRPANAWCEKPKKRLDKTDRHAGWGSGWKGAESKPQNRRFSAAFPPV
jgi:hypothetical protein